MMSFLRSTIGVLAIAGFGTAVTLLMIVEWQRIRDRELGLVSIFHRTRRIVTGLLMLILLGLCFYGWWFLPGHISVEVADLYLKLVFTVFGLIVLSLLWDCVSVYRNMNSFFDRLNQLNREVIERETEEPSAEETGDTGREEVQGDQISRSGD
jgi:hypothetical protein